MKLRASAGMCGVCAQVYIHVCGWVRLGAGVCGCLRVCVLDEFSKYLLETRVNTSADFNMYPIQIFCFSFRALISEEVKQNRTGFLVFKAPI